MFNAHIFMNVTQKNMNNYVVINGERHDLVAIEGCGCKECSLKDRCFFKTDICICMLFDKNPVTGYDGYHFINHPNN